ncbi:hypothetical protein [Corynebacterium gallinarum]|nr:hypothetical protein [Corynebacterium gallinarum]
MSLISDLLAGPRGRDFLMEVALASDGLDGPLFQATWRLSSYMWRNADKFGISRKQSAEALSKKVAPLLEQVPLVEITPTLLYDALESPVFRATYWVAPSDENVFLRSKPLKTGLRRIARHIASSDVVSDWSDSFQMDRAQASVSWIAPGKEKPSPPIGEALEKWREEARTDKLWWSMPPWPLVATSGKLKDGTPGALRFIEDGFGRTTGWVREATVSADAKVFTIHGPGDWAELCRRFPLNVTTSKGVDWHDVTGYPHRWVMPDYVEVAQHYDAVHLSMAGYFATVERGIPVDDKQASMLARWNPGQTFWFTESVTLDETPVQWRDRGDQDWWPHVDKL